MVVPVDIPFPGIHPRVGVQVLTIDPNTYPIRPGDLLARASYGALFYWPRKIAGRSMDGWFGVQAEADTRTASTRFGATPNDLLEAIRRHNAERSPLAQAVVADEWVWQNCFLVGTVPPEGGIRLRFRIDTNHETFVKVVEDAPPDGFPIPLDVVYFDGRVGQPDGQTVRLLLQPASPVRASRTLLGLDIGNTSTTAALLNPLDREGPGQRPLTQRLPMLTIRPVPGHGGAVGASDPRGQPIASELRFDLFRTWLPDGTPAPTARRFPDLEQFPDDDRINAVDYLAGDLARAPGTPARCVVIGAKRMGSSRPLPAQPGDNRPKFAVHAVSAKHRIIPDKPRPGLDATVVDNAVIQLDVRAPLELLACRVFQHFREDQKAWPAKIALTYPTTYSRFELQSLRRAVQKGWLRMQARRQTAGSDFGTGERELDELTRQLQAVVRGPLDLDTQARDPVVQLLIDEASAAAFFHLYRKIFEEIDGGLAAFRYLYEHGLNMLLYDCGGGTTDIALVKAVVEEDVRTLRITVLRRSGVRTFGGDDITRAVCRLLKAKIACLLAAERKKTGFPSPPAIPARPPADQAAWEKLGKDLEGFIEDTARADPQDLLVPTKTLPNQQPTEDRRAAALALWRLGEQLKHWLAADRAPPGVPPNTFVVGEVRLPPMERDLNALTRAILSGDAQQVAQVTRKLQTLTLTRTEIDALIYAPVTRSIANCNKLIRSVLDEPSGDDAMPQEVHWVVASGNAVRYPLLQQMLRRHLAVAFLDDDKEDRRFTFDPENAKDATAKGAVLALASMESRGEQIDPKFDSDLCDRLPFNVGFLDRRVKAEKILFQEHVHYRTLKAREPVKVPLAEVPAEGVQARRFVLLRQFPGDPDFHPFLAFEFPEGIQGQFLSVSYDDSYEFEFRVKDGKDNEGIAIDLTAGDVYRAPAQRGDI